MPISSHEKRPPRVTLINVETTDVLTAQYNPEEVKEQLGANFSELEIQGWSSRPMQYKYTENLEIGPLEFGFDALTFGGSVTRLADARKRILSFFYASERAQDVMSGAPPRIVLVWPKLYSLTCRLIKYQGSMTRFRNTMEPTLLAAQLTFRFPATGSTRITSEDMLRRGTLRAGV